MLMEFVFEVVLMIIVGIFGVFGNFMCIVMFSRLKKKQLKFHRLMILLAIFDTTYIVLNILLWVVPGLSEQYKSKGYQYFTAPIVMPLTQVSLTGSVYCTMAITMERYLTVCRPFYTASKNWSAKRYIIPILVFSTVYNLPRFFELRSIKECSQIGDENNDQNTTSSLQHNVTEQADNSTDISNNTSYSYPNCWTNISNVTVQDPSFIYFIELTELRMDKYYYSIYTVGLNIVLMGIGPFILLISLASLTLRRLIFYSREDNVISQPPQTFYIPSTTLATTVTQCDLSPCRSTSNLHKLNGGHNTLNSPCRSTADLHKLNDGSCNNLSPSPQLSYRGSHASIQRGSIYANPLERQSVASSQRPFAITRRLKTNEIVLSRVSLIISLVFIVCHSIRWIPNIYELIQRIQDTPDVVWPDWIETFTHLSHLLTVFNASVNFYIYYFSRYKITSINCLKHCCPSTRNDPTMILTEL